MSRDITLKNIKECILESMPEVSEDDVNEEASLVELGIDSVKLVEIGVRIEDKYGEEILVDDWIDEQMDLPDEERFRVKSLIEFVESINA